MIMTLVWIILDILKIYLAFCLLQATWWWPMILLFSRNRDSKFAQSRAMKMLSRQALFLLHTACWQACSDRTATVEGALRPLCLRRGLVRRSCKNVTLEALETQLRLPRPLPHWRLPHHWSTATAVVQCNGRLHSFHSFLRCCLSVIRPQRIEVSMALAHISRRPSMTEAAGGWSDRGHRGCSWEQDHSEQLTFSYWVLLYLWHNISYPLSNSGV